MSSPIDFDELMEVMENDEVVGFCIDCGCRHEPVEPDARGYTCEACSNPSVYGASEIIMGALV